MLSEVLRFESSILHYGISSNEEPYSGQVGQLTVRELFSPPTDPKLPPAIHNYQVIIEATVATREEGWKAKLEAHELVHDLDRAWVYVCGRPLHPLHTQLYLDEPPEGWSTNAKEIDARLAHAEEGLYATLEIEQGRHWMQLPFFPLSEALKVRRVLKTASEVTLALTDLHYNALKSLDNHSNLFLLAKALELGNRL